MQNYQLWSYSSANIYISAQFYALEQSLGLFEGVKLSIRGIFSRLQLSTLQTRWHLLESFVEHYI